MHQLVAITFPDEEIARRAIDAIKKLSEANVKIYKAAIVVRRPNGKLSKQEVIKRGHATTAVSALIGGLAGLPFGPLAMAIGASSGALIGHSAELLHEGDAAEFVQNASRGVAPGEALAVVEIAADEWIEFAATMEGIGGSVRRN